MNHNSPYNAKKILCHVGPWSIKQYLFIAKNLSPNAEVCIISGHPKCDRVGFFSRYLELATSKNKPKGTSATPLEKDIIMRCRLLRELDEATALNHLRSAWEAIDEVLAREKPHLILSETIDSYVMDALYFQALNHKIEFIGLVPTFISGYFRITSRGEFNQSRIVSKDECVKVLNTLLEKTYKPDFIKNNNSNLAYYAIARWLRNIIKIPFFFLKRLDTKERFNYHNWATLKVSLNWFHYIPRVNVGDMNWNSKTENTGKKIIYIPLQMIPEATVDYWCEEPEAINYESYLIKLIEHFSNDFIFLIKEHPNVIGYRNPKIYNSLKQKPSVIFVPTRTNSHELIDCADATLVWTGSVGFEAAIRGKPVLTTCTPYYQIGQNFMKINPNTNSTEIINFIHTVMKTDINITRQNLINHVLSGALPGKYIIDGSWSENDITHQEYALNISKQITAHLKFINSNCLNA